VFYTRTYLLHTPHHHHPLRYAGVCGGIGADADLHTRFGFRQANAFFLPQLFSTAYLLPAACTATLMGRLTALRATGVDVAAVERWCQHTYNLGRARPATLACRASIH